jgi:hypothetical protein
LEDVVERDVHTLQLLDGGPQLPDDEPQLLDDGPQLLDDGSQLLDDGLQLLEGLCVGSLKNEDARLKGAIGYPIRDVDVGSRANTSRDRGVFVTILSMLQNAGEEKHQEHDEKDEDLL